MVCPVRCYEERTGESRGTSWPSIQCLLGNSFHGSQSHPCSLKSRRRKNGRPGKGPAPQASSQSSALSWNGLAYCSSPTGPEWRSCTLRCLPPGRAFSCLGTISWAIVRWTPCLYRCCADMEFVATTWYIFLDKKPEGHEWESLPVAPLLPRDRETSLHLLRQPLLSSFS